MLIQEAAFTAGQIHRFTQLQRELYTVLEAVADTMEVGESEQAVAARIRHALKAYGVLSWFHVPVAHGARR
jgi:Xaa-Pro aminopeptidase